MMTTIPDVISMCFLISEFAILLVVIIFAIIDIKTKRVPNKGLVFLLLLVAVAVPSRYYFEQWESVYMYLIFCVTGALAGGGILFLTSFATKGGVGGGDIKLAACIGLFYGPYNMIFVLLIASFLACVYGLIKRCVRKNKELHLAFVPFIVVGCILLMIINIKGVIFI